MDTRYFCADLYNAVQAVCVVNRQTAKSTDKSKSSNDLNKRQKIENTQDTVTDIEVFKLEKY